MKNVFIKKWYGRNKHKYVTMFLLRLLIISLSVTGMGYILHLMPISPMVLIGIATYIGVFILHFWIGDYQTHMDKHGTIYVHGSQSNVKKDHFINTHMNIVIPTILISTMVLSSMVAWEYHNPNTIVIAGLVILTTTRYTYTLETYHKLCLNQHRAHLVSLIKHHHPNNGVVHHENVD